MELGGISKISLLCYDASKDVAHEVLTVLVSEPVLVFLYNFLLLMTRLPLGIASSHTRRRLFGPASARSGLVAVPKKPELAAATDHRLVSAGGSRG